MTPPRPCPVCTCADVAPSVERAAIPVFQNVTYDTAEAARAAPRAPFRLATCRRCGFSYNALFDAGLATYDENYDNHVESAVFQDYYRDLASMLIARFGIGEGSVYDIGCGNGEFLEVFSGLAPGVQAIGLDPSCTPIDRGNFRLIRSKFEPSLFWPDAKLVVLRHVLEHLDEPVTFLTQLREAMPDAPLFVEVPDLNWILREGAFWDFCYEHCNYFTPPSLGATVAEAGFTVTAHSLSFRDQYQWVLCEKGGEVGRLRSGASSPAAAEAVGNVEAYARRERDRIARAEALAVERGGILLWGMATKGVLLSNILRDGLVRGGIDMNRAKQGRYVPGSAVAVHPPEWLRSVPSPTSVFVMNPNYLEEIGRTVAAVGADVELIADLG
jgi:hypothetical protein